MMLNKFTLKKYHKKAVFEILSFCEIYVFFTQYNFFLKIFQLAAAFWQIPKLDMSENAQGVRPESFGQPPSLKDLTAVVDLFQKGPFSNFHGTDGVKYD